MGREVEWGGRLDGILARDTVYRGRAFGTFDGEVPEGLDHWVGTQLRAHLASVLEPGPELLAQDLAALSQTLTAAAHPALATEGVQGVATVAHCSLSGEVLPNEPLAPAVSPPPAAPPAGPPSPPVVSPSPKVPDLNETAAVGMLSPLAKIALPFKPAPGGSSDAKRQPPPDDEHVLPFVDDLPDLSVEQYASLCVERTLDPAAEKEAAKRYRILTDQALETLDKRWRHRFEQEGELRRRWQQAYTQYEAWLRSQKG